MGYLILKKHTRNTFHSEDVFLQNRPIALATSTFHATSKI